VRRLLLVLLLLALPGCIRELHVHLHEDVTNIGQTNDEDER